MSSIVDAHRSIVPNRLAASRLDDSSSSEDEEERRLQEEEEEQEQERILSEQYGEAAEAPSRRKRPSEQNDQDIEAEYAQATTASRTRKKPRPTLTPANLTSAQGLIRITTEFPRQIRFPRSTSSRSSTTMKHNPGIAAAASYSRALIGAYKSFCYDLCPSMAFEDALARMETLGSKKEIKTFLQNMREQARNDHVERLFGKEQAARMLEQLEHGLRHQQQQQGMDYDDGNAGAMEATTPASIAMETRATTSRQAGPGSTGLVETPNEASSEIRREESGGAAGATREDSAIQNDEDSDEELQIVGKVAKKDITEMNKDDDGLHDTDDEADAQAPTSARRRHGNQNNAGDKQSLEAKVDEQEEEASPLDESGLVSEETRAMEATFGDCADEAETSPDTEHQDGDDISNEADKECRVNDVDRAKSTLATPTANERATIANSEEEHDAGEKTDVAFNTPESESMKAEDVLPLGQETPTSMIEQKEPGTDTPGNKGPSLSLSETTTLVPSEESQSQLLSADEEAPGHIATPNVVDSKAGDAIGGERGDALHPTEWCHGTPQVDVPFSQETPASMDKQQDPVTTPSSKGQSLSLSETTTVVASEDSKSRLLSGDETATLIPTPTMDSHSQSPATESSKESTETDGNNSSQSPPANLHWMDPSEVQFSPLK